VLNDIIIKQMSENIGTNKEKEIILLREGNKKMKKEIEGLRNEIKNKNEEIKKKKEEIKKLLTEKRKSQSINNLEEKELILSFLSKITVNSKEQCVNCII
jgi:ribosomal protein S4